MKYLILLVLFIPLHEANAFHSSAGEFLTSPKPVFVHSVYFWLHDNVTAAEKAEFKVLLKSLKKIKSVRQISVGRPAGTPRAVVDNSYDVALIVQFKDKAGHDYYQADQLHKDIVNAFEIWIEDVQIYDMISE